jgi:hypothetical protein
VGAGRPMVGRPGRQTRMGGNFSNKINILNEYVKVFALLGCYTAPVGSQSPTFRHLSVPPSIVKR